MPGDGAYLMSNAQSGDGGHSTQHGSNRGKRGRGQSNGTGAGRGMPRGGPRGGGRGGAAQNGQPSLTNGDVGGQNRHQQHSTLHRPQAPESLHGPTSALTHGQPAPNSHGDHQPGREGGGGRNGGRRGRGKGRGGVRGTGSRDPSADRNSSGATGNPSLDAEAPAFRPSHVSAPTSPVIVPELPHDDPGRTQSERGKARPKKSRQPRSGAGAGSVPQTQSQVKTPEVPANSRSARRAAFEQGSKLSKPEFAEAENQKASNRAKAEKRPVTEADDLIDRLTRGLGKSPFFECPICYNAVTPSQQIWCCLPPDSPPPTNLTPGIEVKDPKIAIAHYQACYTPFHYTCVRDWSRRNLEEETSRLRAIDSQDEPVWRCPGCQKRRQDRIPPYRQADTCQNVAAMEC